MRKIILIGIIVVMSVAAVGIALASNNRDKLRERVIADTTSRLDKLVFLIRGCQILHELRDATALECPAELVPKLKVREDTVFHIMDMGANAQINADDVWALGYTGSGITVAVLDTGIDTDHPELAGSIVGGKGFGYPAYEDDHGHGTHVSGIITANGIGGTPLGYAKGVAPDAGVWMAKVCNSSGSCYSSDIAAAIEHVVNNNIAKIMSISLGGGGTSLPNCDSDYLASKVNWAVDNGVTTVVAAGNTSGKVSSPGCASKAIAVGAVDKSDVRASWSGTGQALDIMAPGVSIYSSVISGYASWSGTSMATPHISATVSLIRQANPMTTDSQIKDALYKTVKDLGATGWDSYYGWGRVDALAAVNYIRPPAPQCQTNTDCNDGVSCTDDSCVDGKCVFTANDGSCPADDWFETGKTQWVSTGQCTEKEQKEQEYRDYYCHLTLDCQYNATSTWVDTGGERNKADGTACDDGFYCNVGETCQVGVCTGGSDRNCDDSQICTTDSCDENLDNCQNTWPACGISDDCCGPECSSASDPDCWVLCWSGTNQYLYRNTNQARKFCKCASGTYGYKSYQYTSGRKTAGRYTDAGNNENWNVTFTSSYLPIYQVTCTDGVVYPTNKDYYYPK